MEDIEKVKNDGKNGIDVSEALISLVFGGYDHDVQRKSWENLGPERILPGYKGSANIPVIKRACHFLWNGGSAKWWEQWVSDQFEFGFFATEGGTCHYGTFQIAAVAAVARNARRLKMLELAKKLEYWVGCAMSLFAVFSCNGPLNVPDKERATAALTVQQVGLRHQGLSAAVASAMVASWLNQKIEIDKISRQPYYWPARVFNQCKKINDFRFNESVYRFICNGDIWSVPAEMMACLNDVRVDLNLTVSRWENAIAAAFPRKKGDRYNDNGSPAYVSTGLVRPAYSGKLTIEPNRDPSPAICTVEETDKSWIATVIHELNPEGIPFQLAMDSPSMGKKLFKVNIPALGKMEITKC